jgi:hypothetical protein
MSRLLPLIEPLESRYAPATLSISLDPTSIIEGDNGTKTITFKVLLTEAPTSDVTVNFFTRDGTAIRGEDFVSQTGELIFEAPGEGEEADLEKEITIVVKGDTKFETNEDFQVILHNALGADLANGQSEMGATATITNDDDQPVISIQDASVSEGNIAVGGTGTTTKMVFTISLSNASAEAVSVLLSTEDGTASSVMNADFIARINHLLTFNPGETTKTFEVEINGDTIGEAAEDFTVKLSAAPGGGNGTISETDNEAKGTITNDDPILRVADVRVAEGTRSANSPNTVELVFTVVLDRAGNPTSVVTVDFATMAGPGTELGVDYVANVDGTLTFTEGQTTKEIKILVNKDSTFENDDSVLLHLSNATNAFIEDGDAVGTIANDEIQASLTLLGELPIRKKEGQFDGAVKYKITLSAPSQDPAGIDVELAFGGGATVMDDYAVEGFTVVDGKIIVHFEPGETTKEISLTVLDDQLPSGNETAQVSISSTKNAVINPNSSQASFEILNDDGTAYLIVDDLAGVAENVVGGKAKVKVRLDRLVEGDVTFNFTTVGGTAVAGQDFTSASGTGTIKAGEEFTFIEVSLLDDDLNEKSEDFKVQISGGSNGATADSLSARKSATVTITDSNDDDPLPTLGFDSTDIIKIVEGDSGTKLVTFKIKLDTVSGREVSVRAVGVSGTATSGQDFTFDQIIKIAAGQTEATFTVAVNGDHADEIDENFFVQLSEADGAALDPEKDQAEVSILNDDRKIFIEDVTVSEGAGQVTFKIRLDAGSLHPVTVKFKTSNGTAIGTIPAGANDDYVPAGEGFPEIVFAPGETEKEVTINLVGDTTAENAETFFGELFEAENAAIAVSKATATITNDDQAFRISDARIVEGPNGLTSQMVFTVKREGATGQAVTIDFATQNGTAVQGQDFLAAFGKITFEAGQTERTITIDIVGDATPEGDAENFSVKLANPTAGTLLDDTGVGTIIDDEGAVVTITDKQIVEGDDGTVQMIFTVALTGVINGTVILNYATEAGTATADDFTTTSGTLTFNSLLPQNITVLIKGDRIDEGFSEEFFVKLTKASGSGTVNLADDTAVGTILDDGDGGSIAGDPLPIISATGGKVIEGNNGQTVVLFTVKLDRPSSKPVTVNFGLNGGTATAGVDFTDIPDTLITFLPGQTEAFITVPVFGDTALEVDETIVGVLTGATNAQIGASTPAKITNDEITVTIGSNPIVEGTSERGKMVFTLSGPSAEAVTIRFTVANGTAIRGTDFSFFDSDGTGTGITFDPTTGTGTVTIPAGQTSREIEFDILDDASAPKFEGNETFTVTLTDSDGAAIPTGDGAKGTFTITDNEEVTVSVEDQFLFEGETAAPIIGTPTAPGKVGGPFSDPPPEPTVKNVQIKVRLSGPSERAITVKASSFLDGDTTAVEGSDFQAFEDQEITFAPGETEKTITVAIIDDQIDELQETFKIRLEETTEGSAIGAEIDEEGTVTILDNDLRGISIGDSSVVEGKNQSKFMTFTVKLSAASTKAITVNANALSSGTAFAGIDFSSAITGDIEDGLITFEPGETEKTITVEVFDDKPAGTPQLAEGDENFVLELRDVSGAIITDSQATGRIITDEIIYKLTSTPTTISEAGNLSARTVTYTVTRSFAPGFDGPAALLNEPGSISFKTVDGTAKANGDYASKTGTVQFAGGSTSGTFTVTVNNDTAFEDVENFVVELTGSTGGALANADGVPQDTLQSTVTINSDEAVAPTLSIRDVRQVEGLSGKSNFVFTVTLSAANETQAVTVNFATEDGTATSELGEFNFQDFLAQMGSITFEPGETTKTISIEVNGDNRHEAVSEETFKVKLSNAQNATIADGEAIGTIVGDDAVPTLIFDGATNGVFTVVEGTNGNSVFVLKMRLSNPSEVDITFDIELLTQANDDFSKVLPFPESITIPAGKTTAEIEVDGQLVPDEVKFNIVGDSIDELDESFEVKVTSDAGAGVVQIPISTAKVTISDDDAAPRLTINDMFIIEDDSGTRKMIFTVTLDGKSDRTITVDFSTLDGTAVSGGAVPDYIALNGTLTFDPNGPTSQTIEIEVYGDEYKEADETFQVKLSDPVNATIARDTGTGTIQQDEGDNKIFLSIKDAKIVEGRDGTRTATFTVELSGTSDTDVVFTASTLNGTAIGTTANDDRAGFDFNQLNQEFTIPAGSTSINITVSIRGDTTFEATESFFVSISGVSESVEVVDGEARGTIFNDDVQFVNSRMLRYVDVDGDLVTIRITKGSLFVGGGIVQLVAGGSQVGGQLLSSINFNVSPQLFNGTSLYVTAEPQPGFFESGGVSDGKADVGFIFGGSVEGGGGIDFTNIRIEGDLGGILAGDSFATPAIRGTLFADSIGTKSANLPQNAPGHDAIFLSAVNAIKTVGDISAKIQILGETFGDLRSLTIGGALRGVSESQPGTVIFGGFLNKATIGQIIGGPAGSSGSIQSDLNAPTSIGNIRVLDGIVGGSGSLSGTILSRNINFLSIGTDPTSDQSGIIGGAGTNSGLVLGLSIGRAILGSPSAPAQIKGGDGQNSGRLLAFDPGQNGGEDPTVTGNGSIGSILLYGDLIGGSAEKSGQIFADKVGSLRINGSIEGGSSANSGSVFITTSGLKSLTITEGISGGSADKSGYVAIPGSVGSLTIGSESTNGGLVGGTSTNTGFVEINGSLSQATIHGDLRGGSASTSGGLKVGGNLGSLTLDGDLIGSSGQSSGQVTAAQIGSARVIGSIVGGSGIASGSLLSTGGGRVNSVTVTESIVGGGGERSGYVNVAGSLGSLTIGTASSADAGNLVGGSGTSSGLVEVSGKLSNATIHGDLRGGTGSSTGGLKIVGDLGTLDIGGNFQGGSGGQQTGFITADRIARMTIGGDWTGGSGVVDSGSIRVLKDIDSLVVKGDVLGTATSRVVLAAAGMGSNNVAIGNLTIGGKVEFMDILGGYRDGATSSNPRGDLRNPDAVIKNVTIDGDVLATNIVAGVGAGSDGRFGTADDEIGPITNNQKLVSLIAEVTIKGNIGETTDAYGIVAQHVKSVSAGGEAVPLQKGAGNDRGDATLPIGGRPTFRVVEIEV